ncbi:MAG: AAA family ATPase [Thermoplasmata archaeon]
MYSPRQVEKTTALKILIHSLLEKHDPRKIFYFYCDELSNYRKMGEIIDNYLSSRRSLGIKNSFIFLDEITFLDEWWRALKSSFVSIDFKSFTQGFSMK